MTSPLAEREDPIAIVVIGNNMYSEIGAIGQISPVRDDDAAVATCRRNRVSVIEIPYFKIGTADQVVITSRKYPWARGADYTAQNTTAGIWTEFYTTTRGRFMRVMDTYRYFVYRLQLANMLDVPSDFPDSQPDLDIGWMVYQSAAL